MTPPRPPFRVLELDHVVLRVGDQLASQRFYTGVLGLTVEHVNEALHLVHLRCGRHLVDLLPLGPGEAQPPTSRLDHVCLSVECDDLAALAAYFRGQGIPVEGEGGVRRGAFGSGGSLYIRDPDGYRVELKPRSTGAGSAAG